MKYKLCKDVQELYNAFHYKPPMKLMIRFDKEYRKGNFNNLESLFPFNRAENEHDALINWVNPTTPPK